MDSFTEQLVNVEKDTKTKALVIAIWGVAVLIGIGLVLLTALFPLFVYFIVLFIVGIFFGAYKLTSKLNVEFEYCVTNGDVDIDMIISKSKRRRMVSFRAVDIESAKLCKAAPMSAFKDKISVFCCDTSKDFYHVVVRDEKGNVKNVAMAPNEKVIDAMKKFMQYQVKIDAFNGN